MGWARVETAGDTSGFTPCLCHHRTRRRHRKFNAEDAEGAESGHGSIPATLATSALNVFLQPPEQPGFVLPGQLVLPNANDLPAAFTQSVINAAIPCLVARDLRQPERRPSLGPSRVLRTAMPKTAVHKHRQLQLRKNKVWLARQFGTPPPSRNIVRSKKSNQSQFSVLVARTTNTAHYG